MHKRRQSKLDSLVRMRRMAEQREELVLEQTAGALRRSEIELRHANDRLGAGTEWKSAVIGTDGWLGLYEQVLLAEGSLSAAAKAADDAARDASARHSTQAARLLRATRDLEVVQRRGDRCRHEAALAFERKVADNVADMWLSRRLHADR